MKSHQTMLLGLLALGLAIPAFALADGSQTASEKESDVSQAISSEVSDLPPLDEDDPVCYKYPDLKECQKKRK